MRPSSSSDDHAWVQPGITAVPTARAFLDTLASRDTLVMPSADGDIGYPFTRSSLRSRGLGATIARSIVAATAPEADLGRYHEGLGLAPEHRYCPRRLLAGVPIAKLVLSDARLMDEIRADGLLRRMVIAFKDRTAEALIERLGLQGAYCAPSASAYERANDKLEFARAAGRYAFDAIDLRPVVRKPSTRPFASCPPCTATAAFCVTAEAPQDGTSTTRAPCPPRDERGHV
jgi:hypothetical protein